MYPLKSIGFRTTKSAFYISIFIWIGIFKIKNVKNPNLKCKLFVFIASFILNMPYFFYYTQQTELNYDGKNSTYCFTDFPNFTIEVSITLYTIIISYILPLLCIIICYIGMMTKFLKKSTEQNMLEHSIKFSNSKKSKNIYRSDLRNTKTLKNGTDRRIDADSILINVDSSLLKNCDDSNGINCMKKDPESTDNLNRIFSRLSMRRTLQNKLSNSSQNKQNENTKKAQKKKTKILILIGAVSITFGLTWLPVHIIQIWRTVFRGKFPYNDTMYILKVVAHTLSYSNSFINPFIYIFVGSKFKSYIKEEIFHIFKNNSPTPVYSNTGQSHFISSRNSSNIFSPARASLLLKKSSSNNDKEIVSFSKNGFY